jgi:hypothetical protein
MYLKDNKAKYHGYGIFSKERSNILYGIPGLNTAFLIVFGKGSINSFQFGS